MAERADGTGRWGVHARQGARFVVVGGLAFLVDLAVLAAATRLAGLDPYSGRAVSYLVAATVAWALHRSYTFRGDGRANGSNRLGQWLTFLVVNAVGLAVNAAVYVAILQTLDGVPPEVALAVASGVALVVNYAANAAITFHAPAGSRES